MTDGKFAYVYDNAGNLIKKGNRFNIVGNVVTFNQTSGEGVLYWEYNYDLLNRMEAVEKNGAVVAEYGYDPEGIRVKWSLTTGEKTHYVS